MFTWLTPLLNIKQSEAKLVKQLFLIQFILGIATAFLNIGSLTLFLDTLKISDFPKVFIISAVLLVFFNKVYAYFEKRKSSVNLLQLIIVFSSASLFIVWLCIKLFGVPELIMLLAVWNLIIYMLIGYAFWGMAAMMFSVRESKRVFSIVGGGDIPAKMLGYAFAAIFSNVINYSDHEIGVIMIAVAVVALIGAYALIKGFSKSNPAGESETHADHHLIASSSKKTVLERMFENKLIFAISLLTVFASIVFYFVDFTFLKEIKDKLHHDEQGIHYGGIATFIGSFFALGRVIALLIKFVFSSRMIARMGLTNVLLITPLLLLVVDATILFFHNNPAAYLYIFGSMVLAMEVLRSVVQEPVFFILFQPLNPHDRLKGHLIAKGYTLPVALLIVGGFLLVYQQRYAEVTIPFVAVLVSVFLLLWIATVYLVKSEYMRNLLHSIKKGYFTGEDMFLNDEAVTKTLLSKLQSNSPLEVINALNLLERSLYDDKYQLLLNAFQDDAHPEVQTYVLSRIIDNNMSGALPAIKNKLEYNTRLKPALLKARFYLEEKHMEAWQQELDTLDSGCKKKALIGLLLREDGEVTNMVCAELVKLVKSGDEAAALLAGEIIVETGRGCYTGILLAMLDHSSITVVGKAIEVAGKLKDYAVYKKVVAVSLQKQLYYSFERSLVSYGDPIFSEEYIAGSPVAPALILFVIDAAAKIKGTCSEGFLIGLLNANQYTDKVIDALWQKKKIEDKTIIENWIETKLVAVQEKTTYLKTIINFQHTGLLQQAISSEIHQDVEVLLKGAALIYDRDLIKRFLEIYKQGDLHKVANALELLELTIHKKYFIVLNEIVELSMDLKHEKKIPSLEKFDAEDETLKGIITNTTANFTSWTRSVAVFILPKMRNIEETLVALRNIHTDDPIFMETKNYVLSILKP